MNNDYLIESFKKKEAQVCVIGLGYVGLPLCISIAKAGFRVIGIDLDKKKVDAIHNGFSYLKDVCSETLKKYREKGLIQVTSTYEKISESQVVIVCVPTP